MFENAVVPAQARASRGRIGLLTASIVAHTAIVFGVVAASIASVQFPDVAPDEYRLAPPLFVPVQPPPPLGRLDAGRPQPQPAVKPVAAAQPTEITAPATVPERVTAVTDEPVTTGAGDPTLDATGTGTEAGPLGVPWGVANSIGDLDAPPAPAGVPQIEERVYQPHEVKAPVLVHKVEPRYPQIGTRAGMSATVVVRCIIDRNGRVRDAEVMVPAAMAPFNAAVLDAVVQWRFTPGSVRGEAVDSYFTLTVRFTMKR